MSAQVEQIWHDFSDQLKGFIQSRVNEAAVADDLLQDVFVKIHTNIDKLNDEARLESWIYRITRNAIIDHYRRNKPTSELPIELPQELDVSENKAETEMAQGLKLMVLALPDKYREALLWTEFGGLTQVELAEKLGISVSGAKSRVQRGRKMLKDMLMQCCHFEFDKRGTLIDYHPIECCCCEQAN